ncbi:MAG TPA: rod shape-determining protein MreC [Stellaceae bacterium]|nr:rod shape-determining protein MreC [Stellaceae bacterium]
MSRLGMPMRAAAQRLALPFLVVVSVGLIVLGKADILLVERFRTDINDFLAPVFEVIAQPINLVSSGIRKVEDHFSVYEENQRLREENARLLQWQEVAQHLETENEELRQMLHFTPQGVRGYITGRVIANSGGAFLRNVLIDVGDRQGVERGQAALGGEGVAGRVTEVGSRAARVLLLTDLNSRVPVVVEDTRERAVLAGDNTSRPRLQYLPEKSAVQVGDHVVTAGSGGIFPPGLPVGVVSSIDGGVIRVEPEAELSHLEYVRIVDFGLGAAVLPQSVIPAPKAPRGGRRAVDPDLDSQP